MNATGIKIRAATIQKVLKRAKALTEDCCRNSCDQDNHDDWCKLEREENKAAFKALREVSVKEGGAK